MKASNKLRYFLLIFLLLSAVFFYSFKEKKRCHQIPAYFSSHAFRPMIKGEINKKPFSFLVDTGACEKISLPKLALEHINKKQLNKSVTVSDFKGNLYHWPIFLLSDFTIGSINCSQIEVMEESPDFYKNTSLWTSSRKALTSKSVGSVGWQLFKEYSTLFDFPNSRIVIAQTKASLEREGFLNPKKYVITPFIQHRGVLVINITTDLGEKRVVLDTGASYSILKNQSIDSSQLVKNKNARDFFSSKKFELDGYDFGGQKFAVTELTNSLEVDGVLGVDFFLEHAFFLDFDKGLVYIEKPKNAFHTQWQRGKFYLTQFVRSLND